MKGDMILQPEGPCHYSFLASNRDLLGAVYGMARGRGVVVNRAKDQIEASFTKPVFPSSRDDLGRLLLGLDSGDSGNPGVHLTHSEYQRLPTSFGDEGERRAFHFFLDIDGRDSIRPAQRVAASMAEELGRLNVPHWVSFSGSEGFHIHIPSDAFPSAVDGHDYLSSAPLLFLDIKHFLVRRALESFPRDLLRTVIHPKRYYGTSRGIQRMPFSLHETTGLPSIPIPRGDVLGFDPRSAGGPMANVVDSSLDAMRPSGGSAEALISFLDRERTLPKPFYHRR
jgi:hypothetical protein